MKYFSFLLFFFTTYFSFGQNNGSISITDMMKVYDMSQKQAIVFLSQKGYKKYSSKVITLGSDSSRFLNLELNKKLGKNIMWVEVDFPLNNQDSIKRDIMSYFTTEDFDLAEEFFSNFNNKLKSNGCFMIKELHSPGGNTWQIFQLNDLFVISETQVHSGARDGKRNSTIYHYFTLTRDHEVIEGFNDIGF
jgi:hypothetical protein